MLTSHVNSNPRQMNFSTCLLRSPFNCLVLLTVVIKLFRLVVKLSPSASSVWSQSPTASGLSLSWDVTDTPSLAVTHLTPSQPSQLCSFRAQLTVKMLLIINPIQIKRGYDKWWALVLSPIISTIIISLNNLFVDFERPWPRLSLPILMVTITFEGLI